MTGMDDLVNQTGWGVSDFDADYLILVMTRHRDDCPTFTIDFEQCGHCNRPEHTRARHGRPLSTQGLYRDSPSIASPDLRVSPAQTYAQIAARSPSPMFGMSHIPSYTNVPIQVGQVQAQAQVQPGAPMQAENFQTIEDWVRMSTYVPSSTSQDTSRLSYAAVAQQAAQSAARSHGMPQQQAGRAAQQRTHQRHQPTPPGQYASFNHHGQAPRQTNHPHHTAAMPRPMPPPQSSPLRESFAQGLPQVSEEMMQAALLPERNPDPRSVRALVQRTQRGSQRNMCSLAPEPYPGTPTSPATMSEASFSTRRTGEARFDPSYPHACDDCRHTFRTSEDLKRHIRNVHTQRQHSCTVPNCTRSFVFPKDLRRHYNQVHVRAGTGFHCPHCTKTYTRKDNLDRHIRSDHGSDSGLGASMSRSTSYSGAHSMSRSTSAASNSLAWSPGR
ncbi:Zinc finger protein [Pseudocercospora fuligena]|uniref:Zinc finger protein n=1 Tax=Pseudocercospora fuligena TaxID=685502 RepID=A0A8H6RXF0_9PEZI|nr:Zinc finger protein [Pseudocercospora fuligena]